MTKRPNLLAGEDLPPPPLQRRSVDKRTRLNVAALSLFAEKGYEATSIEEIARRSQLAVGTFYQHFRSKRQLLLCLMDDLLERLSEISVQPRVTNDRRAALRDVLARAFARDLQYLGAYRAWQEAALVDGDLARKQMEIHAWTTARVFGVLQFLQELPHARSGVDLAGLAVVLDGFFWSLLAQAARMDAVELERWIDAATHLVYHSMCKDPPSPSVNRRRRRNSRA